MDVTSETPHARDLWAPRRQLTLEQARGRSDLVKLLRMLFVAGAAISLGVLLGHLAANTMERSGTIEIPTEEAITMLSPRFTGRDLEGQPFVITADSVQRQAGSQDRVFLSMPTLSDELGGLVTAPEGIYDQAAQTLELNKNVVLANENGYVFQTSQAIVHMSDSRVVGLEPLKGSGPTGEIEADSYEVTDNGARIVLRGHVKMTLYPDGRLENGGQ
ncbi:MAG: LPS export ABC transporter periplasmic protein LptC [Hyphomonadaceae bacterium]